MYPYVCLPNRGPWSEKDRELYDRFLALRLAYVTGMGWLSDLESDVDRYDVDSSTLNMMRLVGDTDAHSCPSVQAGMRLTKVPSLFDSLTWEMLVSDPERQTQIIVDNFDLIRETGLASTPARADSPPGISTHSSTDIWDITRLVAPLDGSVGAAAVVRSIYELIGMATFTTVIEPSADPVWIFLTTATMKRLFDAAGMDVKVLWSGKVNPADASESYLCISQPHAAYAKFKPGSGVKPSRAYQQVSTTIKVLAERRPVASVVNA